jgi:hypothetical protein
MIRGLIIHGIIHGTVLIGIVHTAGAGVSAGVAFMLVGPLHGIMIITGVHLTAGAGEVVTTVAIMADIGVIITQVTTEDLTIGINTDVHQQAVHVLQWLVLPVHDQLLEAEVLLPVPEAHHYEVEIVQDEAHLYEKGQVRDQQEKV